MAGVNHTPVCHPERVWWAPQKKRRPDVFQERRWRELSSGDQPVGPFPTLSPAVGCRCERADVQELLMRQMSSDCVTPAQQSPTNYSPPNLQETPELPVKDQLWQFRLHVSGFGRYDEPTVNSIKRIKMKVIPSCLTATLADKSRITETGAGSNNVRAPAGGSISPSDRR